MSSWSAEQKLAAFTLPEMLVGMVVSGIVVGAIFSAFHIVAAQADNYTRSTVSTQDLSLFHSALSRDVALADSIAPEENRGLVMFFRTNEVPRSIRYDFSGDVSLRITEQHADTFYIRVTEFKLHRTSVHLKIIRNEQPEEMHFPAPRLSFTDSPIP